MNRQFLITVAILTSLALPASAQSDSVLTRVLSDSTSLLYDRLSVKPPSFEKPQTGSIRLASSAGGFVFGIVLGGFSGYEIASEGCEGSCRNVQGDGLIAGAAIGGAIGAALGAAFLELESVCKFDKRLMRSLAGSLTGAAAAFAAGSSWDKRRSIAIIPLGAVGGSLAALGRCWKGRTFSIR